MVLASFAVAIFTWSLVEELASAESLDSNTFVNRGRCVNGSKDWSSRIGNVYMKILGNTASFILTKM